MKRETNGKGLRNFIGQVCAAANGVALAGTSGTAVDGDLRPKT